MQLAERSKKAQAKIMGNSLQNPLESTDFKLREHVTYTLLGAVILQKQSLKAKLQNPKGNKQIG